MEQFNVSKQTLREALRVLEFVGLIEINKGIKGRKRYEDGWFRSGDVGCIDKGSYVFIFDRLKDMIITGGEGPVEVCFLGLL